MDLLVLTAHRDPAMLGARDNERKTKHFFQVN
jgi:hypothetical protein